MSRRAKAWIGPAMVGTLLFGGGSWIWIRAETPGRAIAAARTWTHEEWLAHAADEQAAAAAVEFARRASGVDVTAGLEP